MVVLFLHSAFITDVIQASEVILLDILQAFLFRITGSSLLFVLNWFQAAFAARCGHLILRSQMRQSRVASLAERRQQRPSHLHLMQFAGRNHVQLHRTAFQGKPPVTVSVICCSGQNRLFEVSYYF